MRRTKQSWGSALAASLAAALGASAAVAQPGASWSGPYVGIEGGGDFGHAKWTAISTSDLTGFGNIVDASSPRTYSPNGVRGAVLAGYDWRRGPWVFGPEADVGLSNAERRTAGFPGCSIECWPGAPGPGVDTTSVTFRWDASVRGRLGYLVGPDVLLYGTGGVSWQSVRTSGTCQSSLVDPQCLVLPGDPFKTETHTRTLTGGTVGAGLEWGLTRSWRVRAEYRRVMFGAWHDAYFVGQPSIDPGSDTYRFKVEPSADLVSAGLTFHF